MQIISSGKGVVQSMPVVPISAELIALLEQMIPVVAITPNMKMEDIMYQAGRQNVLQLLRLHHGRNSNQSF